MSSKIPLYTQTSYDWSGKCDNAPKPYAVNLNVGMNEYYFGRTTPNNKFIVASGLVQDNNKAHFLSYYPHSSQEICTYNRRLIGKQLCVKV